MSKDNPVWTAQWVLMRLQPLVALVVDFEKGDVIQWDSETKKFWIRKSALPGVEGELMLQLDRFFEPDEQGEFDGSSCEAPVMASVEQARALVLATLSRKSLDIEEELEPGQRVTWTVG